MQNKCQAVTINRLNDNITNVRFSSARLVEPPQITFGRGFRLHVGFYRTPRPLLKRRCAGPAGAGWRGVAGHTPRVRGRSVTGAVFPGATAEGVAGRGSGSCRHQDSAVPHAALVNTWTPSAPTTGPRTRTNTHFLISTLAGATWMCVVLSSRASYVLTSRWPLQPLLEQLPL